MKEIMRYHIVNAARQNPFTHLYGISVCRPAQILSLALVLAFAISTASPRAICDDSPLDVHSVRYLAETSSEDTLVTGLAAPGLEAPFDFPPALYRDLYGNEHIEVVQMLCLLAFA